MWRYLILSLLAQLFANDAFAQNVNNSKNITGLLDIETPRGERLSAIYKKSFAYDSINERLPIILQKMIDQMTRDQEKIAQQFGDGSLAELQQFIGYVSDLRNDLLTNQPLTVLPLANSAFDIDISRWNDKLTVQDEGKSGTLTFFNSSFLLSECYMYRRMNQALARSATLKTYDPFESIKQESFTRALNSLTLLANYTLGLLKEPGSFSKSAQKNELTKLLKLNLWGNRYDLSISGGDQFNSSGNPVDLLDTFKDDLLIDNTGLVWDVLNRPSVTGVPAIVDIVLDNAGFELFTDMCLAAFLVSHGLAQKVRFYVKRMPWLLSDVNRHDIIWTVDYMQKSSDPNLKALGDIAARHLENKDWTIEIESFWTEPYDFGPMKEKSPALYAKLSEAKLLVIKGDLNYRKLVGDINWNYTTTLETVLNHLNFRPTSLVSLRTFKADLCVGLAPGIAEKLKEKNEDWMVIGKYGAITALDSLDSVKH